MSRMNLKNAVLSGLIAASMVPALTTPIFAENAAKGDTATETEPQKMVTVNLTFVNDGTSVGGGDFTLPEGITNYASLSQFVPEGHVIVAPTGDFTAKEGLKETIEVRKVHTVNILFKDSKNEVVKGGDFTLLTSETGVLNYSQIKDLLPEGYVLKDDLAGDFTVGENENRLTFDVLKTTPMEDIKPADPVKPEHVEKYASANLKFVDENGAEVTSGTYTVKVDENGNAKFNELTAPAGYEITISGDFTPSTAEYTTVNVKKIVVEDKSSVIKVTLVDVDGNFAVGGGEYRVDVDGDGVANWQEVALPEGYEFCEKGDFFVKDYRPELDRQVNVKKMTQGTIVNFTFVDEEGNKLGGGDVLVDTDNDNVANYNELSTIIPDGYELVVTGDFNVHEAKLNGTNEITVRKKTVGSVVNIQFEDKYGNALGGGDYVVDPDGDGIFNMSEVALPQGYKLTLCGDFFVSEFQHGEHYPIVLERINNPIIINVVFQDEEGNNLGGGDFFVDEDGDNVANYNELKLPEGYELIETGDFFVREGEHYVITLRKSATNETPEAPQKPEEKPEAPTKPEKPAAKPEKHEGVNTGDFASLFAGISAVTAGSGAAVLAMLKKKHSK